MIRTCNGEDPWLVDKEGEPCNCGATFDDVCQLVIWPHDQFEKVSFEELANMYPELKKPIEEWS